MGAAASPKTGRASLLCALLAAATLAAYGSFAGFEFVSWDDSLYVSGNAHVQGGLTLESVRWALTSTVAHNWHPLTWLSHMLDVELFGLEPAWHHRVSLSLHVATTLLLFLAFLRMTGTAGRSAFVAGLFALHPLHVESVAWIAERKDVLSGLCFAGALYLYARYAERPSAWRYAGVALVFAAGLAAKPMLVTLPFVLLLLDAWPLHRLWIAPKSRIVEKLPFLALSAASCVITLIAQRQAIVLGARHTLAEQLGNALVSYARYLGGALYPAQLSVTYSHPGAWPAGVLLGCGVLLAGITMATLRARSTRPWLAVGWLWFLGMLVPVIGVIQVGEQALADRYMYLPAIGLFVLAAWGIPDLLPEFGGRARALAVAAIVTLAGLGLLTRAQVQHWRSSTALWEHALAVDPRDSLALEMLGLLAEQQGRQADALALYRRAVEADPSRQNAHYRLANLLILSGRSAESLAPLLEAVRLRPDFAAAHEALGHVYADLGEERRSLEAFERSVALAPDVEYAQYNLGLGYLDSGRPREALGAFSEALRLRPDFVLALVGLADAHAALGNRAAALEAAQRALPLAREQGQQELAEQIEANLARLRAPATR